MTIMATHGLAPRHRLASNMSEHLNPAQHQEADAVRILRRLVDLKKRKDAEGEFPGYREEKDLAWRDAEMVLSFSRSLGV